MQFFTSDQHHFHYNVIRFCNREFKNSTEMLEAIIVNHNSVVSDKDEVWNLGDFAYKADPENVVKIIERLNGVQYFILGNHDKALRMAYSKGLLNNLIKKRKIEIIGGYAVLDKTLSISKMININGQLLFLSHYPLESWPSAYRAKAIMLHGHSHNNIPKSKFRKMDVGIDTFSDTHKRFFPWSYEEIEAEMNKVKEDFKESDSPKNEYPKEGENNE